MTGAGGVLYSSGNFAFGNSTTNISFNGSQMTLNGNVVATANINSNAVTNSVSAFTSSSTTISNAWIDLQSISITTTGNRVYISSGCNQLPVYDIDTGLYNYVTFRLLRDSTELMQSYSNGGMAYSETPSAGTYTYKLQGTCVGVGSSYQPLASNRSLFAMETKR